MLQSPTETDAFHSLLSTRGVLFNLNFRKWREETLLKEARLIALADLGYGVLETAMVETAAFVLRKTGGVDL